MATPQTPTATAGEQARGDGPTDAARHQHTTLQTHYGTSKPGKRPTTRPTEQQPPRHQHTKLQTHFSHNRTPQSNMLQVTQLPARPAGDAPDQPPGQAGRSGKEVAGMHTHTTQIPTRGTQARRTRPAHRSRKGKQSHAGARTADTDRSRATALAIRANGNSSSTTRHLRTDSHQHPCCRPRGGHGGGVTDSAWGVATAANRDKHTGSRQPAGTPVPQQNNEDGWANTKGRGTREEATNTTKASSGRTSGAEFRRLGLRKPAGSTWNQVAHIVGMTAFADQEDDGTEEDNDDDSPTAQVGGTAIPPDGSKEAAEARQRHEEDRARFRAMLNLHREPWRHGPAASSSSHRPPPHDPPQQSDASAAAAATTARGASTNTSTSSQQGTSPPTSGASSSGDSHRPMPLDSPISGYLPPSMLPPELPISVHGQIHFRYLREGGWAALFLNQGAPAAPSYKQVQRRGFARIRRTAEGGHCGPTISIGTQLEQHPIGGANVWHMHTLHSETGGAGGTQAAAGPLSPQVDRDLRQVAYRGNGPRRRSAVDACKIPGPREAGGNERPHAGTRAATSRPRHQHASSHKRGTKTGTAARRGPPCTEGTQSRGSGKKLARGNAAHLPHRAARRSGNPRVG